VLATSRRPLWIVVLALLLASAVLWWSSRLTWASDLRARPGGGAATQVWHTGADSVPALVPLALVALAGVAGVVAVGGWPRRLLGVVLALAGIGAAGLGVLTRLGTELGFFPWGRVLAVLSGVLLVLAGTLLVRLGDRMPKLGAGYRAPSAVSRPADGDDGMWQALSEGRDPTVEDR
jgi:hypothetical protein